MAACSARNAFGPSTASQPAAYLRPERTFSPANAESVVYAFAGPPDGYSPVGSLIEGLHNKHLFFGTTVGGGSLSSSFGYGTVFDVSTSGREKVLFSFNGGTDGAFPTAGVVADDSGSLYGVASDGGGGGECNFTCGTVFVLRPGKSGYTVRVLHTFQGGRDGMVPSAGLLLAANGMLYGTTDFGGTGSCTYSGRVVGCGTVFQVTTSGSEYGVIYRFRGGSDGANPSSALIEDSHGALYGTTRFGGLQTSTCDAASRKVKSCGTVFKVTPGAPKLHADRILYRFHGGTDGSNPIAALYADGSGSFYGLTSGGGNVSNSPGTAYELTPSENAYTERVIHVFGGKGDGNYPASSDGLRADRNGNLYGTTVYGGAPYPYGFGTVFELKRTGSEFTERVLHDFRNVPDGSDPYSSVVVGSDGKLYGTAYYGGTECAATASCGIVYSVDR